LQKEAAGILGLEHAPVRLLTGRTAGWMLLGLFELVVTAWLSGPIIYLRDYVSWLILSVVAFLVVAWPQRWEVAALLHEAQERHNRRAAVAVNLALFAGLSLITLAIRFPLAETPLSPPALLGAHFLLLVAAAISLARMDVPIRSLFDLLMQYKVHAVLAAFVGFAAVFLSTVAISGWGPLSGATLKVTKTLLDLYEPEVAIDAAQRVLIVNGFAARIDEACSGYEGLGLVTVFLCLYLWVFRRHLNFPQALLLLPLGLVGIWLLNSVRIAALISVGAHISPLLAVRGFHSQAGWIAFVAVTVGIMALAQRSRFISRNAGATHPAAKRPDRIIFAYLAPFIALMLASMLISASIPYDRPLYVLKVAFVAGTLWAFRDVYLRWDWRVRPESLVAGGLVAAVWIATEPVSASGGELQLWLERQGGIASALWLVVRVAGAVSIVPIAEELAFRGFLHRWLISRNFTSVPLGQVSFAALVISSLLFGAMHERWIAGALSGAVFAMLMYRTNRLSDPIAAHMAANACICAWAIAWRQWSLL
jgi:exosortase E/protease (VPEID-CTERM system)